MKNIFLDVKIKKKISILEIGSLRGAATASFYYYFDNPNIICADINPFQIQVYSKNIRLLQISQDRNSFKRKIIYTLIAAILFIFIIILLMFVFYTRKLI